jgi:hypothetical protein
MTHHENQVIEIKTVNHIDLRPGRQKEKDVKNEGSSGDVDEKNGSGHIVGVRFWD